MRAARDARKGRIDKELAATHIERVRDELDKAINCLTRGESRACLLRADKMLQQLKSDLGFPLAGLRSQS